MSGRIVDHAQDLLDAIRDQAAAELAALEPAYLPETGAEGNNEAAPSIGT